VIVYPRQPFTFSGMRLSAQTSAPEAWMGLLPEAPEVVAERREVTRRWRERRRARL
jgi:hypothetical protein